MATAQHAIIAGGGIGGLAAAVALNQAGIKATVYERAEELRVGGAGLHLWTNAMLALESLGLTEGVRETAPVQQFCEFRTWRGGLLASWPVGEFADRFGQPTVAIARSALHEVLRTGLTDTTIHTGVALDGFDQDARGVTARFSDGSTDRADLLVGADGVGSAVRAQLLGNSPPRYAGCVAWRGIAELGPDTIPAGSFRSIFGRGTRFVYYDIAPGRVHWMSVENGPAGGADDPGVLETIARRHLGWADPVQRIIAATDESTVIRSDIVDRAPDASWGQGRVTLLGDAAHPMSFNVGQGACQAIEDAVILAERLRADETVPAALMAYEKERKPRTASMQKAAHLLGKLGSWSNPVAVGARQVLMRAGWERGAFKAIEADARYGTRWASAATSPAV
ncbi:FAD-dependent monooxygenase [Streptomyces sp. NPDC059900]|uniref:FAD-dependent monooxygenase n=1 Tax=Streptomyces sp. NPDC059900 TaxID=3155816 RepID=UPI00344563EA